MLPQGSGGLRAIVRDAKCSFGTAPLSFWPDVKGAPFVTVIGGASLWVFNAADRSAVEYCGVVQFLNCLRSTPVMSDWAGQTAFLPVTTASSKGMQDQGYFAKSPGRDVPVLSLTRMPTGAHTNGDRCGRWTEIDDACHEEVEKALQGKQGASAALHNALLRALERTVQEGRSAPSPGRDRAVSRPAQRAEDSLAQIATAAAARRKLRAGGAAAGRARDATRRRSDRHRLPSIDHEATASCPANSLPRSPTRWCANSPAAAPCAAFPRTP